MDTKEKVRYFIISKVDSVLDEITSLAGEDMGLEEKEHKKIKDILQSMVSKHLDNLEEELEKLFNQDNNEEAVTSNGIYVAAPAVWPDPVNTKDIQPGTQFNYQNIEIRLPETWKTRVPSDAITKEQIDEQQPKKHKCSSGSRLDELEARFKELETEIAWLKQRSHIHAFPPIVKKDYNHG